MNKNDTNFKNAYLSIDCSNYFKESSKDEKNEILYKSKLLKEINEDDYHTLNILKTIISKYIEKYFPNEKDSDYFSLSYYLSKNFCKAKKINKNTIEKYINYFYNQRISIMYSDSFILNIEGMKNIGNILSYIYMGLYALKFKSKREVNYIIKQNGDSINVLTDFYNYCVNYNLPPNEENKTLYWFENKKNYNLPGELIFLINLFSKIKIFDFDINFQDDLFNDDLFRYLALVLMNLDLFLVNFNHIKFNFIHEKFEKSYYSLYHQKLLNIMNPDALKINTVKQNDTLYLKKWNFEHKFMLDEYRDIEIIKKRNRIGKDEDKEFSDFTIIENKQQNYFNNIDLRFNESFLYDTESSIFNELNNLNNSSLDTNLARNFSFVNRNTINFMNNNTYNDYNINPKNKNNNDNYRKEIEKYHYTFEIMVILFYYVSNYTIDNIDLVMNDSYTLELLYYFRKYLKIDIKKQDYDFHILDLYSSTLKNVRSLNLEIDSFDLCSFEKILKLILYNPRIKDLKISFFTSDINYFPHILIRSYFLYTEEKIRIRNSEKNEDNLLEFFYPEFKSNLLFLFYLIKKKSLNKVGLNFDIPILVQKKENYMLTILKFLLNILIYLNEPFCKINVLTLLSPRTVLDGNIMNNIDTIFEEMDCNVNNMYLYELYIQFTILKIPHITNIISRNLLILIIGDLDIITFESIVNYFNSYKFANTSLLRKLKIKLINNIICLNSHLKIILRTLFNIKLRNLKKLGLYTNITIKNEKESAFSFKILEDNWISTYTLIFNKYSQHIFKQYADKKNITYLVPHNLENEIIGPEKNNNRNISTNPDDIVYWYLKYIFNKRHYYLTRNFKAQKYYIYNILKYIYFIKKVKIFYDMTSDEEEKKNK